MAKIITIDEKKCTGCGLCVSACYGGAIGLVDGKAKLLREDYCDGLGNCLPVCPAKAISFEERAVGKAVNKEKAGKKNMESCQPAVLACGCLGTHAKAIKREGCCETAPAQAAPAETHLNQWPVQIKLVAPNAQYFNNAHLLVAADCTAFACGSFHNRCMKNKITIIGCPKLDEGDDSEKLTAILKMNEIKSVTVARMEVPCCGGLENAVKAALQNCGKLIPWQIITISTDGKILE